jgi:hypothetical protein
MLVLTRDCLCADVQWTLFGDGDGLRNGGEERDDGGVGGKMTGRAAFLMGKV